MVEIAEDPEVAVVVETNEETIMAVVEGVTTEEIGLPEIEVVVMEEEMIEETEVDEMIIKVAGSDMIADVTVPEVRKQWIMPWTHFVTENLV